MKNKILLVFVITIAAVLRLWQLGQVPPSLDWDEAALGYNAYSVLKTGRDEYGTAFPLVLRSYDDYKPPLYMYLTIPSVGLFGLEPWAVRLPSAVLGILAVIGTYFLVVQLLKSQITMTNDQQGKKIFIGYWILEIGNSKSIALLSAMLLALSPWHIQFSRIAFEANSGLTLNIWAAFAFLKGLHSRAWLCLSAFLFGLGLYAYHSERIFVPLLVLILATVFRKELFARRKDVVLSVVIGTLTVLPLLTVFLNPTALLRLRGTSSLADQTGLLARSVQKLEEDKLHGNIWGIVFDNRRVVWAKTLLDGYLSHYSLKWLFLTGDNPRHHAPDMGLLYLWELPFLLWGMYFLARSGGRVSKILFGWFLIAPIAASPTTELPHAIRTLVFLPTLQIFTALGIMQFASSIKVIRREFFALLITCLLSLIAFNILYYFHAYFVHMNSQYSESWQYGYKDAVGYVAKISNRYKKIIVSTKLEQPHMFFLFYLRYDPALYLAEGGTASGGFAEVRNKFGKFEFRPIDWESEAKDGSVLYVGTPREIPAPNLTTIAYLDGLPAVSIAD
ncbi:hypothetical protein HY086_02030 [Candidatus Gottesmanbacteria bacterium]|nr:hypothetical protein [Candidatus Gottesmanbacteria bacterium]